METVIKINTDLLNLDIIEGIKKMFPHKTVEISIQPADETEYILQSPNNAATPDLNLSGIYLSNCTGTTLKGNSVTGTVAVRTNNRTKVAGVYISKSPKLVLECNHMSMIKYGFITESSSATTNTAVKGNTFNDHVYGMLFRYNLGGEGTLGDIGSSSINNNNSFTSSQLQYGYGNGTGYRLYTISNCLQPYTIYNFYSSILNSNHSGGPSCKYAISTITTTPYNGCPQSAYPISDADLNMVTNLALAEQIARDSVVYAAYQDVSNWVSAQRLYHELYYDTTARNSSNVLDSFYQTLQNAPIGRIYDVEDWMQGAGDSTMVQDSLYYQAWLDNLKSKIDLEPNVEQYELNEADMDNLFVKFMRTGGESFTQEDSTLIANLALQCPYVGGTAVYKARSLYSYYMPQISYDDIELCNHVGENKGGKGFFDDENSIMAADNGGNIANQESIKVYPNPAQESITIEFELGGIIEITDLEGRITKRISLLGDSGKLRVDITNIVNGIYLYRHIIDGQLKETGKIAIIH